MKWTFAFAVLRTVDIGVLVRSETRAVVHEKSAMSHFTGIPKNLNIGLILPLDPMSPGCI